MRLTLVNFVTLATASFAGSFVPVAVHSDRQERLRNAGPNRYRYHGARNDGWWLTKNLQDDDATPLLLEELQIPAPDILKVVGLLNRIEGHNRNRIMAISDGDSNRFDALLGLYDVSFVNTRKEGENPVGGKWTRQSGLAQKLLRNRRSFQHVLPVNSTGCGLQYVTTNTQEQRLAVVGEVINVISLEALWGWIRTTVILRGDAVAVSAAERTNASNPFYQPLSAYAVRALFDAPRIVLGRTGRFFNINIGPKTSVVLDTLCCDDKVRIGLGGRSGSRFAFTRCLSDDAEANEFRALVARKPWNKSKTILALATLTCLGIYGVVATSARSTVFRVLSFCLAVVSMLFGATIAFSGGGIESRDRSVTDAKRIYEGTGPSYQM
jgi:hypothetical protein